MYPELIDSFASVGAADVEAFEHEWRISLPQDYREFLLRRNGGVRFRAMRTLEALGALATKAIHALQRIANNPKAPDCGIADRALQAVKRESQR